MLLNYELCIKKQPKVESSPEKFLLLTLYKGKALLYDS